MRLQGIEIEGRDLVASVVVIGVIVGGAYGSVPESAVVGVLFTVLSAYGLSSRYHKTKRKRGDDGGGS